METKSSNYFAHVSEDGSRLQTVADHLRGTAKLAKQFAASFDAAAQGELAGELHDIGKYSAAFQRRLLQNGSKVDHSTAGAKEAISMGLFPIAFAVAGHHSGLPDGGHSADDAGEPTLNGRFKKTIAPYDSWKSEIFPIKADPPAWVAHDSLTLAFYTRMLYSCLVDADFLDTETFMDGQPAPRGQGDTIAKLLTKVRKRADQFMCVQNTSPVVQQRNAVLKACLEHGRTGAQGLYTLTVPTGGGKTFASLAFALEHANAHQMSRVIYVIPYMSIVDQTAKTFLELLGEENVLAHYSGAEYQLKASEDLTPREYRQVLAAENWDAPIIVTTAVQFFESLYANRSSRCRKLHNIANSVVIFDEAQTLPSDYLRPCVHAIGQLVQHYHTTAVLCTATQPELGRLFKELGGGMTAEEISPEPKQSYEALRRVTFCDGGTLAREELQKQLVELPQVLCVVDLRKTAQELFERLPPEGSFCLTTLLCAADRRAQLDEIRMRLKEDLPCRVVSTSLIEAGVDVDFPAVYREQCGLDSLLQAAGRCNREGKRPVEQSKVTRFRLRDCPPPQMLHQGISALEYTMRRCGRLDTPEAIHCYFEELIYKIKSSQSLDKKGILPAFEKGIDGCAFPFAQVAERFHIIESPTRTVYLPIGKGEALCQKLRNGFVSRSLFRQLGPYGVSCYQKQFDSLNNAGTLEILPSGDAILIDLSCYDPRKGLIISPEEGQGIFA